MMTGSVPSIRPLSRANTDSLVAQTFPEIKPEDIVIAVMGVTGSGKTTFVNLFADQKLVVGHGLDSCTTSVAVTSATLSDQRKIFLVDTPGFDDTRRTDSQILLEVALWLNAAHISHIKLTGIVYLHRIGDTRVGGSGIKNLRMFKKLCGNDSLSSVILATTMWNEGNREAGSLREEQLKKDSILWKPLIDQGSKVFRQDNDHVSGETIIRYLINRKRPVTLDIQHEMVDKKMTLNQTAAGSELVSEVEQLKRRYDKNIKALEKQLADARAKGDRDMKEIIEQQKAGFEDQIAQKDAQVRELEISSEQLQLEVKKKFEAMVKEIQEKELAMQKIQISMEMMESKYALQMEIQNLKSEMKMKEKTFRLMQAPNCNVM